MKDQNILHKRKCSFFTRIECNFSVPKRHTHKFYRYSFFWENWSAKYIWQRSLIRRISEIHACCGIFVIPRRGHSRPGPSLKKLGVQCAGKERVIFIRYNEKGRKFCIAYFYSHTKICLKTCAVVVTSEQMPVHGYRLSVIE